VKGSHVETVYKAVMRGEVDKVVDMILADSVDVSVVNEKDEWGLTLLHWVAATGKREVAEFLISLGADVNARSNNGWRPLKLAMESGDPDMTSLLVQNGARR
jgi:ankyrin repeat protein